MIVGIDPGSNKSGVAVMENGRYTKLLQLTFMEIMTLADDSPDHAQFYVEDPNSMRAPHAKHDDLNAGHYRKMAQNVGQCAGVAKLLIAELQNKGKQVYPVKPQRGLSKRTKKDKAFFNRITGWTGNSNEHKRDAAMLIYKFHRR